MTAPDVVEEAGTSVTSDDATEDTARTDLNDLIAKLDSALADGALSLAVNEVCPEWDQLVDGAELGTLGMRETRLRHTADAVSISGVSRMFGYDRTDTVVTFGDTESGVSVTLVAKLPDDARIEIPGFTWASLGSIEVKMACVGATLGVPIVSYAVAAVVTLSDRQVVVSLAPGASDWVLRIEGVRLPGIAALATLLGIDDASEIVPPGIPDLSAAVVSAALRIRPDEWSVTSVDAVLEFPRRVWQIGAGLPTLREVSLAIAIQFPADTSGDQASPDSDAEAGDDDDEAQSGPLLTATARATVKYGELQLPVRLALEPDAWRMGIIGAEGFPSFGELVAAVADRATAKTLPDGLGALRLATATVDLELGRSNGELRSLYVAGRLADEWPLIEGHLVIDDLEAELVVDRVGDQHVSGFVAGVLHIEDLDVAVDVRKPETSAPWTLSVRPGPPRRLSGIGAVADVLGGNRLEQELPSGIDGAGIVLDSFVITVESREISSASVKFSAPGPWAPLGADAFEARDLTVDLAVAWPTDAKRRTVTGTVDACVDVVDATVVLRVAKASADAQWRLEGALDAETSLSLIPLVTKLLPSGTVVPTEVPDLAISSLTVAGTPATGEVLVKAATSGSWALPLGASGLTVADLTLELQRDDSAKPMSGAIGGAITIGESTLTVSCVLGEQIEIHGQLDRISMIDLVEGLTGPGTNAELLLPTEFVEFELSDVRVEIIPARGRFGARASLPGFETVAVVVDGGSDGWGFAIAFVPDADWRLSRLSADLAAFDEMSFGKSVLVLSTVADMPGVTDLPAVRERLGDDAEIGSGLTFSTSLELAGTGADQLLGLDRIMVRAAAGADLSSMRMEAAVAGNCELAPGVVLRDASFFLVLAAAEQQIGLAGRIDVVLDSSELSFVGAIAVAPNGFSCSVTMEGTWVEPFGTPGISVSNVALSIGSSFQGLPTIGIAGSITIGTFHGEAAVLINAENPGKSALILRFNSLQLGDVVDALCRDAIAADPATVAALRSIFDISFSDVEIYVVPLDTKIGTLEYSAGTRLRAHMFLWGLEADASVAIDSATGLLVDGSIDPIELGALAVRRTDGHARPTLHFAVGATTRPEVLIAAELELLGLSAEALVALSDDGFVFRVGGRVFDLFEADLEVRGGDLSETGGILVRATMRNDLLAYLRTEAVAALQQAAADAESTIGASQESIRRAAAELSMLDEQIAARREAITAERDVNRRAMTSAQTSVAQAAQAELADLDRQINSLVAEITAARTADTQKLVAAQRDLEAAQREVDSLLAQIDQQRAIIQGERDLAVRRMQSAQADVDAAQRNVDSILTEIASRERWWQSLPDAAWPWEESKARAGIWYGPMIAGLYTGYGTATAALKVAAAVLDGIKAGSDFSPFEADPRVAGLYVAYGPATAALEVAKSTVAAAQAVQTLPPIDADPRLVALRAQRDATAVTLDVAIQALQAVQTGLDTLPMDLDPEIVALTTARAVAAGSLVIADGVLEATKVTVVGALKFNEYILNYSLGGLFDVRRAEFEGSLDAVSGGAVRLRLAIDLMGTPREVELDFQFTNPTEAINSLVEQLVAIAA